MTYFPNILAIQQYGHGPKEVMSEFLDSSAKKLSNKMEVPNQNGCFQTPTEEEKDSPLG